MTEPNAVDWTTVLLALISLIGTIATGILAYLASSRAGRAIAQGEQTAKAVDGVVSKLMEAKDETAAAVEAKGRAEGKADVLDRAPPPPGT